MCMSTLPKSCKPSPKAFSHVQSHGSSWWHGIPNRSIQIYTDLYRTSMTAWGSFCGATSLRDYDWPGWQSETQRHRGGKLRQNVGGICDFLVDTMGIPILVPVVCRPSAICQLDQVVLQWMLIPLLLSSGTGYPE